MSLRPPPLPTSWRRRIDTKSLDEAQHIYSARSTPVRLERIGRRTDFAWRSSYAALGPLGISTSWFDAQFIPGSCNHTTLSLGCGEVSNCNGTLACGPC